MLCALPFPLRSASWQCSFQIRQLSLPVPIYWNSCVLGSCLFNERWVYFFWKFFFQKSVILLLHILCHVLIDRKLHCRQVPFSRTLLQESYQDSRGHLNKQSGSIPMKWGHWLFIHPHRDWDDLGMVNENLVSSVIPKNKQYAHDKCNIHFHKNSFFHCLILKERILW